MKLEDIKSKTTGELVAFYNAHSGRPVIKKFADRPTAEKRVGDLIKARSMHAPGLVAKAAEENGAAKVGKRQASDARRIIIKSTENPRREGTLAAEKWDALVAYMAKNPGCTIAQVFEATIYQRVDFNWDLKRGAIEVS